MIVNQCDIKYDKHKYRLKEINWHKIKNNLVTNEEIKDYSIPKLYYLHRWLISPTRSHSSITIELINQYSVASKINFTTFQNIKKEYNKLLLTTKSKMIY